MWSKSRSLTISITIEECCILPHNCVFKGTHDPAVDTVTKDGDRGCYPWEAREMWWWGHLNDHLWWPRGLWGWYWGYRGCGHTVLSTWTLVWPFFVWPAGPSSLARDIRVSSDFMSIQPETSGRQRLWLFVAMVTIPNNNSSNIQGGFTSQRESAYPPHHSPLIHLYLHLIFRERFSLKQYFQKVSDIKSL